MYIYGQTDADTAQRHYKHLLNVTKALGTCLENVIAKKCGVKLLEESKRKFEGKNVRAIGPKMPLASRTF
jgi:hypothetical protein